MPSVSIQQKYDWILQISIIAKTVLLQFCSSKIIFAYMPHILFAKIYFLLSSLFILSCLTFTCIICLAFAVSRLHCFFPAANYDLRCWCTVAIYDPPVAAASLSHKRRMCLWTQATKHEPIQSPLVSLLTKEDITGSLQI